LIGRRKVLKLLGLTPLAAKASAEKAAIELSSMRGYAMGALADGVANPAQTGGAPMGHAGARANYSQMAGYLRTFGKLPAHIDKQYREDAKYVAHLDPDLLAKRSWSLCVKIQEQQERNYRRKLMEIENAGWYERGQKMLRELTGWEWSW